MTPARFRKFALALEGVEEVPHMDRAAFRTKRKIFATLGRDATLNLLVHPADKRDALLEAFPEAIHSLGGWTRLGYLAIDLGAIDDGHLRELVTDAWRESLPVIKAKKKTAAKKKKAASKRR